MAGCLKGQCHYREGNLSAIDRVTFAQHLLEAVGVERDRVQMITTSAGEPQRLAAALRRWTSRPNPSSPVEVLSMPLSRRGREMLGGCLTPGSAPARTVQAARSSESRPSVWDAGAALTPVLPARVLRGNTLDVGLLLSAPHDTRRGALSPRCGEWRGAPPPGRSKSQTGSRCFAPSSIRRKSAWGAPPVPAIVPPGPSRRAPRR